MALGNDMAALSAAPLFGDMNDEQLRLIAFAATKRAFRRGERVHVRGEPAEGATLVASGTLLLSRSADEEDEGSERAGRGALLDELALLNERDHAETATAETEGSLILVDRTLFRRMLEEYPDIAGIVRGRIADRLAGLLEAVEPVAERLERLDRNELA